MLTVVHIITRLNVGGAAKCALWLAEGMRPPDFRSFVVAGTVEEAEDSLDRLIKECCVRPIMIESLARGLSPLRDAVAFVHLVRALFRLRPQVVHTHMSKAGLLGRLAALVYRMYHPVVAIHQFHGHTFHSYFHPLKERVFLFFERFMARYASDALIVVTRQQFEEIHGFFKVGLRERFAVIPYGIPFDHIEAADRSRIQAFREEFGLEGMLSIALVARIAPIKNHEMFIEAARVLFRAEPRANMRFVIIGGGHEVDRNALSDKAREAGIADKVIFTGNRDDPEVFYHAVDVVGLTSLNEGCPFSVIEGMAVGRPFISTAVGGVVDLVQGEARVHEAGFRVFDNGILVPSRDAAAFSEAVRFLAADPALRESMGRSGKDLAWKAYGKSRMVKDTAELYRRLWEARR